MMSSITVSSNNFDSDDFGKNYTYAKTIILNPDLSIKNNGKNYILKVNSIDIHLSEEKLIDLIIKSEMALNG